MTEVATVGARVVERAAGAVGHLTIPRRGAVLEGADLRGADLRMPEELDDARSDGGAS